MFLSASSSEDEPVPGPPPSKKGRRKSHHPWVSPGTTPEREPSPEPEPRPKPKAQPRPRPRPSHRAKPTPQAKPIPQEPAMPKLSAKAQAQFDDHKAADKLNDDELSWTDVITKILCRFPHPNHAQNLTVSEVTLILNPKHQYRRMILVCKFILSCLVCLLTGWILSVLSSRS